MIKSKCFVGGVCQLNAETGDVMCFIFSDIKAERGGINNDKTVSAISGIDV